MSNTKSGRAKLDIVARARPYCTQQSLKHGAQLNNGEMDEKFIVAPAGPGKEISNRRVFEKVENYGKDFDSKAVIAQRGFSVVDVIANDADPAVARAADVYRARIWPLLRPPAPTLKEYIQLIGELLGTMGLFRARFEEIPAGLRFATSKKTYRLKSESEYFAGLAPIVEQSSFDSLTLLCALYGEAQLTLNIHLLEPIDNAFERCLQNVEFRYGLGKETQLLISWLCRNRVFAGRWRSIPDEETKKIARNYINAERRQYGGPPLGRDTFEVERLALRYYNMDPSSQFPIVPLTDELAEIRNNLPKLLQQIDEENWFPPSFQRRHQKDN